MGKPSSLECATINGQTYCVTRKPTLRVISLEDDWYEDCK